MEEEEDEEEKAATQEVEEKAITQEEQAEDCDIDDEEDSQDQDYDDNKEDSDLDDDENRDGMEDESEENSVGPVGYTSQSYRKDCCRDTASSFFPQTENPLKDDEFDPETCSFSLRITFLKQNTTEVDPTNCIFQEYPLKIFPLVFLKRLPLNVANTASVRLVNRFDVGTNVVQRQWRFCY
ncbi:hypothetical protein PHAVU_001G086000 [Phaseolus vulgaris]|nr:hypothetical protein PHAVU_001G086000g [Phaseolus vulgaris]ESW33630.1 hypothetical protein PHAVU_001G086000g [Phaseolus vulgaris]